MSCLANQPTVAELVMSNIKMIITHHYQYTLSRDYRFNNNNIKNIKALACKIFPQILDKTIMGKRIRMWYSEGFYRLTTWGHGHELTALAIGSWQGNDQTIMFL